MDFKNVIIMTDLDGTLLDDKKNISPRDMDSINEFCDKGVTFGIQVSHSHRRSNRPWKPNVKRVKAIVNGTPKHVYVCTHCLRSGKVTRAV